MLQYRAAGDDPAPSTPKSVEVPDGTAYAVAVFSRAARPCSRQHDINRAIGEAARQAIEALRGPR